MLVREGSVRVVSGWCEMVRGWCEGDSVSVIAHDSRLTWYLSQPYMLMYMTSVQSSSVATRKRVTNAIPRFLKCQGSLSWRWSSGVV